MRETAATFKTAPSRLSTQAMIEPGTVVFFFIFGTRVVLLLHKLADRIKCGMIVAYAV